MINLIANIASMKIVLSRVILFMEIFWYNWSGDCLGFSWRKHDKSN